MTRFSERALNRATLARQLLLERQALAVPEAVRQVVALQAQEPASPYLALWNRIAGLAAADVDAAFAAHEVVKSSLVRITLHAVHADDHGPIQHAMQPALRGSCLNDRRFTDTGLTAAEVDAAVPDLLAFTAEARTTAELEAWLEARFGREVPRAWWALRRFAPVVHAPTGPPWSFGPRPAYVTAPVRPPTGDPAESVQHLLRRYLHGFGPATMQDFAQFSILRMPAVQPAFAALADELVPVEGPGRHPMFDVPGAPRPDEGTPAPPRLLGMWESALLAHADRGRILPPDVAKVVIRRNGDALATLLVDGFVSGVWRPAEGGGIEVTTFRKLTKAEWRAVGAEAGSLTTFLADRDPDVHRRYAHWWQSIPAVEVRVF